MFIRVEVYRNINAFEAGEKALRSYRVNHNDNLQRRVLGEQCRNAFEGGQVILTYPIAKDELP